MSRKETVIHFLKGLRETIIESFESLEATHRFERKKWDYQNGKGGGEMAVIRGSHFEKAAVNFSTVEGDTFPGDDSSGPFFATGVSLITHMINPHAPTVHFNIRYIETEKSQWLGGGYDLTPMGFPYDEDTNHFHSVPKKHIPEHYPEFSENAKKYFFIPHRKKERGVGGIFFDHISAEHLEMWKTVGNTFLEAIMPIYHKRIHTPYTEEDKLLQLTYRAHYVEFNLLYDRGTQFGFRSGGNPEAILCSMPPLAKW